METEFTASVRPYIIKDKRVLNYEIVRDPIMLQEFIDWLPDLEPHETYYVSLLARSKYCKDIVHIKSDVQQLRRFTTTKERMLSKIQQLEIPLGRYLQKDLEIPQEALALYIHPNPRNQIIAARATCRDLLDLCLQPYNNYNVHQVALSNLQQARGRKIFYDWDYDKLDLEVFKTEALNKVINQEAVSILKTRGGFHALVSLDRIAKEFEKVWYNGMKTLAQDDDHAVAGDLLMAVPGCVQGDFTPYFLTLNGVTQ